MKEYVSDMVPKLRLAALKDVPIRQLREEYVEGTAPRKRRRLAAMKDVAIKLSREEFVSDTVRHGQKRLAAMKDAPA